VGVDVYDAYHESLQAQGVVLCNCILLIVLHLLSSVLGITAEGSGWVQGGLTVGTIDKVAYENGFFLAYGTDALVSRDGVNWTPSEEFIEDQTDLVHGNGVFLIGKPIEWCDSSEGGMVYASTNGFNWQLVHTLGEDRGYSGLTYSDGKFYVGQRGAVSYASEDGFKWNKASGVWPTNSTVEPTTEARGPIGIVKIANGIQFSKNGKIWQTVWTDPKEIYPYSFDSIAFGAGLFVATQGSGMKVSIDGYEWQNINVDVKTRNVLFGNDRFVALADTTYPALVTSKDGRNWEILPMPERNLSFDGTHFTSIRSNAVYFSTNALQWNPRGVSEKVTAYGSGTFIRAESEEWVTTFWTSTDGLQWGSPQRVYFSDIGYFTKFSYVNGLFFAEAFVEDIGMCFRYSYTQVFWSMNGLHWTRLNVSGGAVAFGDGEYLLGGNQMIELGTPTLWRSMGTKRVPRINGTILVLSKKPKMDWGFYLSERTLNVWGLPGRKYRVEYTEALSNDNWVTVDSGTISIFPESFKPAQNSGFYRTVITD
jgi:hypothetical protein